MSTTECAYTLYNRRCESRFHKQYPPTRAMYASFVDYIHGPSIINNPPNTATPGLQHLPASIVEARNYNAFISLFAALPTEILVMIEQYADPPSIMALRGSCARFMNVFPDPTADANNIWEVENWRKAHAQRRRIYRLRTLCEDERAGVMATDHLTCSACITSHHKSNFDAKMRDMEPEQRLCEGYTRPLRLCEHKSATLTSLKSYNPDTWCGKAHSQHDTTILCRPSKTLEDIRFWNARHVYGQRGVRIGVVGAGVDEEGHAQSYGEYQELQFQIANGIEPQAQAEIPTLQSPATNANILKYIKPGEPEIMMRTETVLLRCDHSTKISNVEILPALRNLDCGTEGRIAGSCPHFDLHRIINLLNERPYTDCPNLHLHDERTRPCLPSVKSRSWISSFFWTSSENEDINVCQVHHTCTSCSTSFFIHRTRCAMPMWEERDELVLCIVRKLGSCRDPFDAVWLAQLEQDNLEDLSFWGMKGKRWKGKGKIGEEDERGDSTRVKGYPAWHYALT
ncbi:hypothetical protein BDV96DRAFT_591515 [Lophiotrema nucula]|uniref:F-box domain-containing protein n=1 Tax=Lophiotrema nucula TaxID=690887 RepID=A0A6A5YGR5_9PLEO|nr:hypothetical protein BDV96DRAFT_591515 [Lophiotrema nucula]